MIKSNWFGTWDVVLYGACGMAVDLLENVGRDEAAEFVRSHLRQLRRQGYSTSKIRPNTWDVSGPDDQTSIGEDEGLLVVRSRLRRYRSVLGRRVWLD